ncbi:MAG: GNAT family N-acetyltransferase [Maricaulis sp.]|jgi:RimJ/RimL family protein N-acetyltransferase|nr:GNAT family N-acetyltransferase [Maricaulis sp.]
MIFADLPTIETERLILRGWREEDRTGFAAINADPAVMEFFPAVLTTEQSDARLAGIQEQVRKDKFCWHAVERRDTGEMIGFTGLAQIQYEAHYAPTVEIGWRLTPSSQGKGFATEAARASLRHGFEALGLEEIISLASLGNTASISVMRKIGLTESAESPFDHPSLMDTPHLNPCVLYRIRREEFDSTL